MFKVAMLLISGALVSVVQSLNRFANVYELLEPKLVEVHFPSSLSEIMLPLASTVPPVILNCVMLSFEDHPLEFDPFTKTHESGSTVIVAPLSYVVQPAPSRL